MSILRHVIVNMLLLAAAVAASIYIQPYSLHHVFSADYKQFDQPPDSAGQVGYSQSLLVDYRLPQLSLSPESVDEIREVASEAGSKEPFDALVSQLVALVRSRLNPSDKSLPPADSVATERLYRDGKQYYSLCSDYARLLNEVLQAAGLQGRIVWMEGHVVVESFDASRGRWVFLDPHMNLRACSPDGTLLSISELIHAVERELPVEWSPICSKSSVSTASAEDAVDPIWYRNILLNGECYVLSGETLAAKGRWNQLLRYRSRPQVVALDSPFDTSASRFHADLRLQAILLVQMVIVGSFYLGRYDFARLSRSGRRARVRESAGLSTPGSS